MPLPDERNTTYAPGSQVQSDDLNDIQDGIVAAARKHRTILVPTFTGVSQSGTLSVDTSGRVQIGSTGVVMFEIPGLLVGDVISEVRAHVSRDGGMDGRIGVKSVGGGYTTSVLFTGYVTSAFGDIVIDDSATEGDDVELPYTVAEGDTVFYWQTNDTGAGERLNYLVVEVNAP